MSKMTQLVSNMKLGWMRCSLMKDLAYRSVSLLSLFNIGSIMLALATEHFTSLLCYAPLST